jgi:hypothetical protein
MAQIGIDTVVTGTTLAISVALLIVGILAAIYARRALEPPRRQLEISVAQVSPVSPMLATAQDKFSVSYAGDEIKSPYVCILKIQNTGKHAVSSAQFDSSKPIEVDLRCQIVAPLDNDTTPKGTALPEMLISGSKLQIFPSVLARGQTVEVSLLTKGKPIPIISHHLIDTGVDFAVDRTEVQKLQGGKLDRARRSSRLSIIAAAVAAIIMAGVASLAAFTTSTIRAVDQVTLSENDVDESTYYPANGVVPSRGPSDYSVDSSVDHCDKWSDWARSAGAVPVNNRVSISISSYNYTDSNSVSILKITPHVFGTFNPSGKDRLRCSNLMRNESSPDYQIDLAKSGLSSGSAMRTVNITRENASVPLVIELKGADGVGYEYDLDVEYSVDGQSKTESLSHATRSGPLRTVFESSANNNKYYDWDAGASKWTPQPQGS